VEIEAKIQVVVPCYDEAARLDLDAYARALRSHPGLKLLFVDDGSRDDTRSLLQAFAGEHPDRARVLALPTNVGKASAVRAGVLEAFDSAPDYVAYWDADLSTPFDELPRLVAALSSDPACEVALGSRVRLLGRSIERLEWRHYLGRVVAFFSAWALGIAVYDTQCGAKVLRVSARTRALFEQPFDTGWTFDVELIARWLRDRRAEGDATPTRGLVEVPLHTWVHHSGSKVGAGDLPRAFQELWRIYRKYR
jgi:glycosyltransferase involved in cell wall biosynthesis